MVYEYTEDDKKWLAVVEESESLSVDELIYCLEKISNGANAHTVNKARMYLNYFSSHKKQRYIGKYDRLHELKAYVLDALKRNDWLDLKNHMKSWF